MKLWDKLRNRFRHIPFIESNLTMGPMSLIRFITGPIRAKAGALLLGTRGVGFVGTALQFQIFGMSLSTLSMGNVVQQELGESLKLESPERHGQVLDVALLIQMVGASLIILVGLLVNEPIRRALFGASDITVFSILPVLTSIPLTGLVACYFLPLLYANGRYDIYSKIGTRNAVIELCLYVTLCYFFGIQGALWSLLGSAFAWCAQLVFETRPLRPSLRRIRLSFDPRLGRRILQGSLLVVFTGGITYGANLVLRSLITHRLGDSENGCYQVLLVFSAYYIPLITSGIWAQLMPKLSRSESNPELWKEWASFVSLAAWCGVAVEVCLLVMPGKLVSLLFSKSFAPAQNALPWEFLGDFFFLLLQPCLAVFFSKAWYKGVGLAAFLGAITMIPGCLLLLPRFGLSAAPLGYLAGNLTMFAFAFLSVAGHERARFDFGKLALRLALPLVLLASQVFVYLRCRGAAPRFIVPAILASFGLLLLKRRAFRRGLLYLK